MTCRSCRELLSGYRENELAAAVRELVQAHLNDCAACRRRLAELDAAMQAFRSLRPSAAPPSLREEFYQRLAHERAHQRGWARGMVWTTAICLVVGWLGGWAIQSRGARNPLPPRLAANGESRRTESPSPPISRLVRNLPSHEEKKQHEVRYSLPFPKKERHSVRSLPLARKPRLAQSRITYHARRNTQDATRKTQSYIIILVRSAPQPEPEPTVEISTATYHVELTHVETGERSVVGFERVMEGDDVKSLSVCLGQENSETEKPRSEEVGNHVKKKWLHVGDWIHPLHADGMEYWLG